MAVILDLTDTDDLSAIEQAALGWIWSRGVWITGVGRWSGGGSGGGGLVGDPALIVHR